MTLLFERGFELGYLKKCFSPDFGLAVKDLVILFKFIQIFPGKGYTCPCMKASLFSIGSILIHFLTVPVMGQVVETGVAKTEVKQPVYMLTYDHGGLILWGSEHFQERLGNATNWLDRYPGFKIGLDNEAHMYDDLAEHEPEVLREIQQTLQKYQGRFGIGTCTYGQPLSQFINEESNIRQVGYALKTMEKHFGTRPAIYLMSEHAMHAQIPQIIKGFGFSGAIMRTHFMMYGYNPTYEAPFGWWVGMDGTRIPAVPTYKGEGAEFFKTTVDNWILTRYPGEDAKQSLQDFRKQFSGINPLLASRADDSGLRKEELVREYEGNPGYRWILLEELLDLCPDPQVEFITEPEDFTVRMPWGYCGNSIWNTSRRAEVGVLTAERLAAMEYIHDGQNREHELLAAWKNLLVAQHHDIQIVGLTGNADRFLGSSLKLSGEVRDRSMTWAASKMTGTGKQQVTVFNPLSWEQDRWIQTSLSFERGEAYSIDVNCADESAPVAYLQTDRYSDGSIFQARIAFYACMSALSLNSYSVVPRKENPVMEESGFSVDALQLSLTTPYYQVQFDSCGGIQSLEDRRSGVQIFRSGQRSAFFCGTIDGEEKESTGRWIISREADDSPWITATEYGFIANIPYAFSMKFHSRSPRIDCRVEFRFDGQWIGQLSDDKRDRASPFIHDKKLRFKCYPSLSGEVTGIKDLPFVVTETLNPNVEGNYWTAVSDRDRGLAYFNSGNMGSVRERDGGFSIPLSYAMYYIWGTRMLTGSYSYEFALFPFSGPWTAADLHRQAIAYNFPPVSVSGIPGDGSLGHRVEMLDSVPENVILSALYTDEGRVFLRFYESTGKPAGPFEVLKDSTDDLIPVSLSGFPLGEPGNPVQFTPWQIRTFEYKRKR